MDRLGKIDPRLLRQLQRLEKDKQVLQGRVSSLEGRVSNQGGGLRDGLRSKMKGIFGGLGNPRISGSKISPLPRNCRGRRLF